MKNKEGRYFGRGLKFSFHDHSSVRLPPEGEPSGPLSVCASEKYQMTSKSFVEEHLLSSRFYLGYVAAKSEHLQVVR